MAIYHIPDSSQQVIDKTHKTTISHEGDQQDALDETSLPTRQRTGSLIQRAKDFYTHAKEAIVQRRDPSQRRRAVSTTHSQRKHNDATDSSGRSHHHSPHKTGRGRQRSSTFSSTNKKVISDTDEEAQQKPSLLQYALGR